MASSINFTPTTKVSVIVQSETSRLTQEQIRSALREALDQAEKPNELPRSKLRGISKEFIPSYRSKLRGIRPA